MLSPARKCSRAALAGVVIALGPGASAQRDSGTEYRSLNTDVYHLAIQKNGRVDVQLGGEQPVVFDAFPMIWFDGEAKPERIKTDGRWTERYRVDDRLGQGQGMRQRYKGLDWTLRVYPTRPFFALQAAYTNTGKRPVTVRALMPWCVGAPAGGAVTLGARTEDAAILAGFMSGRPALHRGEARSGDAIAIANATTGRSFIAGFLTQDRAQGSFELGAPRGEDESAFYEFRAVCTFDPPVTIAPGEQIATEVLYIAAGEPDPVVGLQRFARAVIVANKSGDPPGPFRAWIVADRDARRLTARLEMARELADSRFVPNALIGFTPGVAAVSLSEERMGPVAAIAEAVVDAGLRPAVWCDPTAYMPGDPAVLAHPDWFLNVSSPDLVRTLDLGRRESAGLLENAARGLAGAGIDTIAGLDISRLADASFSGTMTPTECIARAIGALRVGLGESSRIYAASPSLLASILTDGVVAPDGSPVRSVSSSSIAPSSYLLGEFTGDAAWNAHAAASLSGAAMLIDLESALLWPDPAGRMAILFPPAASRATPSDLFVADQARVLHAQNESAAGLAHTVAVFNWNKRGPELTALPLGQFGARPGTYYTVYDFWNAKYLGTAVDRLEVAVAPADVSLLVLRPYQDRPMPLITGANLGQNEPALDVCDWDGRAARLRIALRASNPCTLPFLFPDNLEFERIEVTAGTGESVGGQGSPRLVHLRISPDPHGRAEFELVFARS